MIAMKIETYYELFNEKTKKYYMTKEPQQNLANCNRYYRLTADEGKILIDEAHDNKKYCVFIPDWRLTDWVEQVKESK